MPPRPVGSGTTSVGTAIEHTAGLDDGTICC